MRIGITQGRLLPPVDGKIQTFPGARWREEFDLCRQAGFDGIEWVHSGDAPGYDPIVSQDVSEIKEEVSRTGVRVLSACYDAILDEPLFQLLPGNSQWEKHWLALRTIAGNLEDLGGSHIVLPLLVRNKVTSDSDRRAALEFVRGALAALNGTSIQLHLETSMRAADLKMFVKELRDSRCKVTFDTGNILQFGYDLSVELDALKSEIGSIHFKDSKHSGTTVPLGTGDVDFAYVAAFIRESWFDGDGILQGARIAGRDDFDLCSHYLKFVKDQLGASSQSPVAL